MFSIILNLIFSLKVSERMPIDYSRYVKENSNFDKIIMPPPFLPNPDFANEVENSKSLEKINENFNNFRFKSIIFLSFFNKILIMSFQTSILSI